MYHFRGIYNRNDNVSQIIKLRHYIHNVSLKLFILQPTDIKHPVLLIHDLYQWETPLFIHCLI